MLCTDFFIKKIIRKHYQDSNFFRLSTFIKLKYFIEMELFLNTIQTKQ